VQENINGVRIIRAYASEQIEINKFGARNDKFKDGFIAQAKTVARYNIVFSGLSAGVSFASTVVGAILAVNGHITVGQFTTFAAYVFLISNPILDISNRMGQIQNSMICGARMFGFLNTGNIICDPPEPDEIIGKPNLAMRNVSIKLSEHEELKDVSVEIPYGKKLGIMGKTGSGKSVMIKALTRLFETTYGETLLNGKNLKCYRVEDVRRQFGYVMQEVFLFSNTVDANIAYYNPDVSRDEVVRAAKTAQADGFILKLSDGYETVVGERGLGLSGGQKQRISIARALLKDAPVILLDDCTSSLDLETERKILEGIKQNYADRTLIIASHRASSVSECDEILYLEDGRITESGSHAELMAKRGKYYGVFTSQEAALAEALA
jgi:ATP-binding cassette subfamily B protein